jgi:CheY-like chemotaxis protein
LSLPDQRILVAEDNVVNQRLAQTILERAGCQVTIARDGAEAVDLALRENFHLIFMDGHMPNLDGYDATRAIRKQLGRYPPIVALTANALSGDRAICVEAGMDDCLTKPYRPEQLIDMADFWTSIGDGAACAWNPQPASAD